MRSAPLLACLILLLAAVPGPRSVVLAGDIPLPSPAKCRLPVDWIPMGQDVAGLDEERFPPPPADDRGYDVLSYDLDIQLDPVSKLITGQIDIGLRGLHPGTTRIRLDLVDDMNCDGVRFQGGDAVFTHGGDSLVVFFEFPLTTTGADTLRILWNGHPPRHGNFFSGLMFRTHDNGTPEDPTDDPPMIANQNQPWSAHSWWPCKDHPADKALVSLIATVPEELTMVSNGTLLWEDSPGPGLRRTAWREAYPIATYLVSVAATDFISWSEVCPVSTGDAVRLDYHVFPHDREDAETDLGPTCDMMEFMTSLAGPYPFPGEKYAQAEIKWFGSMEHQTATSLSQIVFTGDRQYELVVLHELAHMWFGDSLTPAVWSDIWLNEGFARYFEALWLEEEYGPEAYRANMRLIGPERHPDLFVNDGLLIDPDPILPNTLIYDKGAWVLHMLRMWIGRTAFERFIADYAAAPELVLGSVTLADMIGYAERASGRDLGGFFDPWLKTSVVPVIQSNVTPFHTSAEGHQVKITLKQLQVPLFEVAVPLVIHTSCGDIQGIVRMAEPSHTTTLSNGCRVDSVSIDPEGMVLMRHAGDPAPILQVDGPWPNPVANRGAEFRIYLTSERKVTVKLYDTRGRLLDDEDLGRLTATGSKEAPETRPHLWTWSLSEGTARIPAGVYWAEFVADGARAVRKFTLLN